MGGGPGKGESAMSVELLERLGWLGVLLALWPAWAPILATLIFLAILSRSNRIDAYYLWTGGAGLRLRPRRRGPRHSWSSPLDEDPADRLPSSGSSTSSP